MNIQTTIILTAIIVMTKRRLMMIIMGIKKARIRLRKNNNIDNDDSQNYSATPPRPLSREAFSLTCGSSEMRQLSATTQCEEADMSANTCDTDCQYSNKQILTNHKSRTWFTYICMHAYMQRGLTLSRILVSQPEELCPTS